MILQLNCLQGNVVDQTCTRSIDYDDEDICKQSSKIINFIDLAGDQRYLHTTAFGLSGYSPNYAVLVVRFVFVLFFSSLYYSHSSFYSGYVNLVKFMSFAYEVSVARKFP